MSDTLARGPVTSTSGSATADRIEVVRRPPRTEDKQERRDRRARWMYMVLGIVVPAAVIALWQVVSSTGAIDARLYPSPSTIVSRLWDSLQDGDLIDETRVSLQRVLGGYVMGVVFGGVLGAAMGLVKLVRSALEPSLNALYVVPKLALLPVFITIFGLGESSMVALIGWTVFFFVWINTMEAFSAVPVGYREAALSLDLSRFATFRQVLLPCALPQIVVGLRVSMNVAILVTIGAEFVIGGRGLGYFINNARQLFITEKMYAGIVAVAIIGVVIGFIVAWIGNRLTPWTRQNHNITKA